MEFRDIGRTLKNGASMLASELFQNTQPVIIGNSEGRMKGRTAKRSPTRVIAEREVRSVYRRRYRDYWSTTEEVTTVRLEALHPRKGWRKVRHSTRIDFKQRYLGHGEALTTEPSVGYLYRTLPRQAKPVVDSAQKVKRFSRA